MTKSTFDLTLATDGVAPHRPGIDEVGGASWEDQLDDPGDPQTMPTAGPLNQLQLQAVASGATLALLVIAVGFVGGAPQVSGVLSARSGFGAGGITVTRVGAGDIRLTWDGSLFPAPLVPPMGSLTADQAMLAPVFLPVVGGGVEVKTRDSTGTLMDCPFVVVVR